MKGDITLPVHDEDGTRYVGPWAASGRCGRCGLLGCAGAFGNRRDCPHFPPGSRPGDLDRPMTIMVSKPERDRIDVVRLRSYELAVARGHIRR